MTERRDTSPHGQLVRFWCDEYERRVGVKYPFQGGKDGKTIKWLLEFYSADDIKVYIAAFFELEDDFIENSGYSLGVFRGCLPKVIQAVTRAKPKADRRGHFPPCRSWKECDERAFADAKRAREAS